MSIETTMDFVRQQGEQAGRIWSLYGETPAVKERAEWCKEGSDVPCIHVACASMPDNLEVVVHALAGAAVDKGSQVIELCHGQFDGAWVMFAKLQVH